MSEAVSASQRYREITGRVDEAVQRTLGHAIHI